MADICKALKETAENGLSADVLVKILGPCFAWKEREHLVDPRYISPIFLNSVDWDHFFSCVCFLCSRSKAQRYRKNVDIFLKFLIVQDYFLKANEVVADLFRFIHVKTMTERSFI